MPRSELARKLAPMISDLGSRFMMDPAGFGRAGEMNLEPGLGVYVAGRFGVLGRVHSDVVAACAVFFNPELVSKEWNAVMELTDPATATGVYASIASEYGRVHFANVPNLDRWVALAERAVDSISPVGAPMFAGWRAVPRPDDVAGRASLLAHVLRELRFSLHGNAVVAAGYGPVMSIICGLGDKAAGTLAFYGWPEPYPEPTEADRAGRWEVEEATNDLSTTTFAALSDAEFEEFVSLTAGMVEASV